MIRVSKIYHDAKIPTRKFPEDAGMDLYAYIGEDSYIEIEPGEYYICSTGIAVEIPNGFVGLIFPKSKNRHLVGAGVVDSNYQGTIYVRVVNYHNRKIKIEHNDPVGQLVIVPVLVDEIKEVWFGDLYEKKSNRGETGGIVNEVKSVELSDGRAILESDYKPAYKQLDFSQIKKENNA